MFPRNPKKQKFLADKGTESIRNKYTRDNAKNTPEGLHPANPPAYNMDINTQRYLQNSTSWCSRNKFEALSNSMEDDTVPRGDINEQEQENILKAIRAQN